MVRKLGQYIRAKYRAFAPLSCLQSPRNDVVRGWRRWRWLTLQRQRGRLIDPTVQVWCMAPIEDRLTLGLGATIARGVILWIGDEIGEKGRIILGEGTYIGPYTYVGSCHELEIGDHTLIGAHSYLITVNHRTDRTDVPVAFQGFRGSNVRIGRNAWLGCHVVVLPGVTIGDNAIVGAGAVVTKSVPAGETWGGVPAKKIESSTGTP